MTGNPREAAVNNMSGGMHWFFLLYTHWANELYVNQCTTRPYYLATYTKKTKKLMLASCFLGFHRHTSQKARGFPIVTECLPRIQRYWLPL